MCSLREFADSIVNSLISGLQSSYRCTCSPESRLEVAAPEEAIVRILRITSVNPPIEGNVRLSFEGDLGTVRLFRNPFTLTQFYRSQPPTFESLERQILETIQNNLGLQPVASSSTNVGTPTAR